MATESSRILVVDDNRVNRLILEKRLGESGYLVTCVSGGVGAMEALHIGDEATRDEKATEERPAFDAVVLDIMMPDMDGIELLRRIRSVYPPIELPVIMATAKDGSEDALGAFRAGANDFVTKPVDVPLLVARIATQIDLRRSHDALRSAQRSLIHAAKAETVAYLAAGVAHEVRNPLARIQMAAEGLRACVPESGLPMLEILERSVARADSVVQRLISSSEKLRPHFAKGDLNAFVRETLGLVLDGAEGVEFEENYAEELPQVRFAPDEFRQVIVNLVVNALQAMKGKGGGKLTVRTEQLKLGELPGDEGSRTGNRLRSGDPAVAIHVEDTGPGIPEEKLANVFDAFYTTRATGEGQGLGLTIARKLTELHGGMLALGNRKAQAGVRATVFFPLRSSKRKTV